VPPSGRFASATWRQNPTTIALLLVDEDLLVGVLPAIEATHLQPEGYIADLVATDGHEVSLAP
jgi:hypothetical protein